MSYLTHRAEHAVIAALLADTDPPLHLYGLTGQEFSSRLHREMFTAISDLATTHPGLDHATREQILAAVIDAPGATVADLAAWRAQAPDVEATASYAELVRAGAVYRDMATYTDAITQRLASGTDLEGDPELAGHQHKLIRALARHARAFANLTADDTPDASYPLDMPVAITPARSDRAVLEDQVLADLLRDPEQIPTVVEFLTDNAFTSSQRRHVYRTMTSLTYDGEAIDEVTLAWRIETETAQCALHGIDVNAPGSTPDGSVYPVTDTDTEPAAVYLTRLAATTITVASAVDAGRDLLVAHLRDILPNPKAVAEAIMAQRADTARQAVPSSTRRETTATARTTAHAKVRVEAARPGYASARPPGPLPGTGPEPQPGPAPSPSPSIQPGVRP